MIEAYGLWLVFGLIAFESMGLPLPGESALIAAAVFAGTTHGFSIYHVIGAAAAGAVLGDNVGYMIGRSIGHRLLARYGKYIGLGSARLMVGQYLFLRHGGKIVFFGRFVALLRAFAALLAGANQMPWPHFLAMNAFGGVCWAALIGTGAYIFGENITLVAAPVGIMLIVVSLGLVVAGVLFFRHHEKELERRAREAILEHSAEH